MLETFACSQRITKELPYKDKDDIYSQKDYLGWVLVAYLLLILL